MSNELEELCITYAEFYNLIKEQMELVAHALLEC